MTAPNPDLVRAVRAGCDAADIDPTCRYPDCGCKNTVTILHAALSELAEPSAAMIQAGAEVVWDYMGDAIPYGAESGRTLARAVFGAMMRRVLGEGP